MRRIRQQMRAAATRASSAHLSFAPRAPLSAMPRACSVQCAMHTANISLRGLSLGRRRRRPSRALEILDSDGFCRLRLGEHAHSGPARPWALSWPKLSAGGDWPRPDASDLYRRGRRATWSGDFKSQHKHTPRRLHRNGTTTQPILFRHDPLVEPLAASANGGASRALLTWHRRTIKLSCLEWSENYHRRDCGGSLFLAVPSAQWSVWLVGRSALHWASV